MPVLLPSYPVLSAPQHLIEEIEDSIMPPLDTAPCRTVSPFPAHPYVIDACSLQAAVSLDAQRIFDAIQTLINERDTCKVELFRINAELKSVGDDLKNVRLDYKVARERYEELFQIASLKQRNTQKMVGSLPLGQLQGQISMGPFLDIGKTVDGLLGVDMEGWMAEGIEGEKSARFVDNASDLETEWSAEGSVGSRSLDPNAVSYTGCRILYMILTFISKHLYLANQVLTSTAVVVRANISKTHQNSVSVTVPPECLMRLQLRTRQHLPGAVMSQYNNQLPLSPLSQVEQTN